ncbi:MAG: FAD-dependent oxidoreductase [Anaerolineae bacterium]
MANDTPVNEVSLEDLGDRERLRLPALRLSYRPIEERIQDFEEACQGFTAETARVEASRCIQCPSPPACQLACPLNNDIRGAMREIAQGSFLEAAAIYRKTSNFPELCGRLCPDEVLCAGSCPVGRFYPELRLGRLEAFVTDQQRETVGFPIPELPPSTGKSVAVVGSGPAGLTVAEELAKRGHRVTIFDQRRRPGGTLVYTLPRFRLPIDIVEEKVAQLEAIGVSFVPEAVLCEDVTIDDLFDQGYDAVFLGTGAGQESVIGVEGADLGGVYLATEFLTRTNLDTSYLPSDQEAPIEVGERVTIFGGGHAATDCARTAIRLGAEDVIIFQTGEERGEMYREEDRLAAQEEGVSLVSLTKVNLLIGDRRGHVVKALCQRMRPGRRDHRSHPVPIEGSTFTVDTDLVILAPELGPDVRLAETTKGLEVDPEGWLIADEATGRTTREGVFAAGDNVGKMHLAVIAIAEGRKVAAGIHRYIT